RNQPIPLACLVDNTGAVSWKRYCTAKSLLKRHSLGQPNPPFRVSVLAKRILSYWLENPGASDTVDGIAVWWVQYKEFEHSKPRIEHALAELVNKGLVLQKCNPTSQDTYALNPAVKRQVRRIVKGQKRGGNT